MQVKSWIMAPAHGVDRVRNGYRSKKNILHLAYIPVYDVYVIYVICVIWYVLVMIFYHFMDCKHGRDVNMKFRMRSRVESRTSCLVFLFIYSSGWFVVGNPNQTMGPWRGSLSWRWAWKTKTSLKKLIAMRYTWLHTSPHFTWFE